jgi:hypothetical protein
VAARTDHYEQVKPHSLVITITLLSIFHFSADEQALEAFERMRVQVHHNGSVHWEPGGVFETTCDMNIAYFPFDRQSCSITIGSWAYYSAKMDLFPVGPEPELQDFHIHGEWEMLGSVHHARSAI